MTRITTEMMINAYAHGYFPMAEPEEDGQIYWYLPEQRALLPIDGLHVSRSLKKTIRHARFEVHRNRDFEAIVRACADRGDTWLSEEIMEVFFQLHKEGFAHSVGVYEDATGPDGRHERQLVGGIYGMTLGRAFFAESMFHRVSNASKVALVALVEWLRERDFELLDVQFMTDHLRRFGAFEISAEAYQRMLDRALGQAAFD